MAENKSQDFQTVRSNFLKDLNSLAVEKADSQVQNAAERFFRSAYDFARLCRINCDQIWSNDEDKNQFYQQFDPAIRTFATAVQGLCSILRAENQYTAKLYLSTFEFLRNDLRQLYENNSTVKSTDEFKQAMQTLEKQQAYLGRCLREWEYDRDYFNPNEWEMPNLEKIPKQHQWWKNEILFDNDSETDEDS
jgi:hypothetical protein